MTTERLPGHEETLPAYEDMAHVVRRIVREELAPVMELLQAIKGSEVEIEEKLDTRLRLVGR